MKDINRWIKILLTKDPRGSLLESGRNAGYDRSLCSALVPISTKSKHARMGPRLGMRDRAWLGMLTATACDAGIDRWADMRDAESGIRDPGSGMIPKEGSGIITGHGLFAHDSFRPTATPRCCEVAPPLLTASARLVRQLPATPAAALPIPVTTPSARAPSRRPGRPRRRPSPRTWPSRASAALFPPARFFLPVT